MVGYRIFQVSLFIFESDCMRPLRFVASCANHKYTCADATATNEQDTENRIDRNENERKCPDVWTFFRQRGFVVVGAQHMLQNKFGNFGMRTEDVSTLLVSLRLQKNVI